MVKLQHPGIESHGQWPNYLQLLGNGCLILQILSNIYLAGGNVFSHLATKLIHELRRFYVNNYNNDLLVSRTAHVESLLINTPA